MPDKYRQRRLRAARRRHLTSHNQSTEPATQTMDSHSRLPLVLSISFAIFVVGGILVGARFVHNTKNDFGKLPAKVAGMQAGTEKYENNGAGYVHLSPNISVSSVDCSGGKACPAPVYEGDADYICIPNNEVNSMPQGGGWAHTDEADNLRSLLGK